MKRLYLLQGVPGAGKSTIADFISMAFNLTSGDDSLAAGSGRAIILSTDDLWYGDTGEYEFDVTKLALYHQATQQRCIREMQGGREVIIIDNCNIKEWHARPYIEMAKIYEYSVTVVNVDCGLQEAIRRQDERPDDRKIPVEAITRMYGEMERIGQAI